ncbi:hypothetical protein QO202_15865, partial [Aeromonas caviae]|nr:hypothetical protein [Aeromonas caviae]
MSEILSDAELLRYNRQIVLKSFDFEGMADAIAQGIHEVDPGVAVKIYNVARHDKNEILTQVFRSKGILVGSSTMNNVM